MYLYIAKETTHMCVCVWVCEWFGDFWSKCYCNWCNKSGGRGEVFTFFCLSNILYVHELVSCINNSLTMSLIFITCQLVVQSLFNSASIWPILFQKNTIQIQLNESFYGIQTTFCMSMSTRFPSKMIYDALRLEWYKWNKCECDFKF